MEPGAAAREACEQRRWATAWQTWSTLDPVDLDVDDLDRAATAAYLTGHDEEGFVLWGIAHRRCLEAGMIHQAAAFGMRLAQTLSFKGDLPRVRGWVERTGRLLDDSGIDCVEQGYLACSLGMQALFEAGDALGALERFEQADKLARRFGDRELATLARIAVGRMKIYLGDRAEGVSLLDEAMISIEARELSALATGDAYCTVIDACAELSDVSRCRAWTESMQRWCDTQEGLVLYRGHCFLHAAEVLVVTGAWSEALSAARHACGHLARPLPSALGHAMRLEADVLRLLGRPDDAQAGYQRAGELGHDPQPGLALLRLAEGLPDAAAAMIRRAATEAEDPISRSRVLGPLAEVMLAVGDVDSAHDAAEELGALAAELGSTYLQAEAALAVGAVGVARGDLTRALPELRRAFRLFADLDAGPRAACTRLHIADACLGLGDHEAAATERALALAALDTYRTPARGTAAAAPNPDGLTDREVEVLRLLASGRTNRALAAELFISEKTVASHVSHIFAKIGVTSRAAATAFAYDHDLM